MARPTDYEFRQIEHQRIEANRKRLEEGLRNLALLICCGIIFLLWLLGIYACVRDFTG